MGFTAYFFKVSVASANGLDLCACVGRVTNLVRCTKRCCVWRQWSNVFKVGVQRGGGFCWGFNAILLCGSRVDTP